LTKAGEFSSYASGWYYRPLWEAHAKNADWQNPSLPRCVAHTGDTTRSMSYLMACPTIGFGVVALTNVGPAPDSDRWDRFTDALVHAALGTTPPTYRTDPLTGHAAAIMLTVLLIQLATLMALLSATRRQRRARLVSATAITVSLGALWLGWIYAPHYNEQPAPLTAVWDGAPDLAVTTFTASLLALIAIATVATSVAKAVADRH
jgi:hypothetical protein